MQKVMTDLKNLQGLKSGQIMNNYDDQNVEEMNFNAENGDFQSISFSNKSNKYFQNTLTEKIQQRNNSTKNLHQSQSQKQFLYQ